MAVPEGSDWTPRLLFPPLSGHDVQSALREAACERWDKATELLDTMRRLDPARKHTGRKVKRMAAKLVALLADFDELLGWIIADGKPLSEPQADLVAEVYMRAGFPASEVLDLASKLTRRPRGRPEFHQRIQVGCIACRCGVRRRLVHEVRRG